MRLFDVGAPERGNMVRRGVKLLLDARVRGRLLLRRDRGGERVPARAKSVLLVPGNLLLLGLIDVSSWGYVLLHLVHVIA